MSFSSSTAGWIAVGAAAGAVVVALLVLLVWIDSRRGRAQRETLLGESGSRRDLVDFAITLQGRVDDLHRAVDEIAAAVARVDRRMDATIARTAIVRYDAYEQAGGRQSASVALLDANRTGIVISAIQGRDYARVYVKELDQGKASAALSPEEQQAVERAMAR
ncbi:MAG TPA: DUF4446 family protein [Gaiellaceae bacterium]|nr:DUF4446 family protein [Gaiellaceae bacterium]